MQYEPVIGLEIHIQLNTKRKMFCYCPNNIWQKEPNAVVCPTCLGLPGTLPVANKEAIRKAQLLGLALGCKISKNTNFDRKNYFYPDLPKGYQISQYDKPFCYEGVISSKEGDVRIRRIHLEEDTGKSLHDEKTNSTLLDFNKSGIPLVELVTEPDIKSSAQAVDVAKHIAEIAKFLQISNVDMERGNLRLEPSISLRPFDSKDLPNYRVELKNINSFRFMQQALDYEIKRQTEELEQGKKLQSETRGYNESKKQTFTQRVKEEEHEYRYFPEPDIPPFEFSDDYFDELKKQVPRIPEQLIAELSRKSKVESRKVEELVRLKRWDLVEKLVSEGLNYEKAVNMVLSANEKTLEQINEDPQSFVKILNEKEAGKLSSYEELDPVVEKVIGENKKSVEDYKKGQENALNYLVGQVMRETGGKANPQVTRKMLQQKINSQ